MCENRTDIYGNSVEGFISPGIPIPQCVFLHTSLSDLKSTRKRSQMVEKISTLQIYFHNNITFLFLGVSGSSLDMLELYL